MESRKSEVVYIDINTANEYEWQQLNGIGPYFAKRIVNFRDALGGFHSIDQISETYGFPDSVFNKIQPFLKKSDFSKKIAINQVSRDELARHPYISRKKSSILINYRSNHGPLTSVEDLYRIKIFDSTEILRLTPYLEF